MAKPPSSNPAKPLLYLCGGGCSLFGLLSLPTGLFVGPHLLLASLAMLGFGLTSLWLSGRSLDRITRWSMFAWSVAANVMIVVATVLDPPTAEDIGGVVFVATLKVLATSVGAAAILAR